MNNKELRMCLCFVAYARMHMRVCAYAYVHLRMCVCAYVRITRCVCDGRLFLSGTVELLENLVNYYSTQNPNIS